MAQQQIQSNAVAQGMGHNAAPESAPAAIGPMSYSEGAATLSASAAPRARSNLLSKAAEREAVRYNVRRGFPRGTIRAYQNVVNTPDDGDFGPNTVEAIAAFQQRNGLEADGKIGPRTQHALDALRQTPQKPPPADEEKKPSGPPVTNGGLTANFSLAEFQSHDGAAFPQSVIPNLRELATQLEVLRAEVGTSIHITSGYRSPAHNAAVGGAKNSQHMKGQAADITVSGLTPSQVKAKIEKLIKSGRMKQGGVGLYSTFVHYDTRGTAARW